MKRPIFYIILFSTFMGCIEPFDINTEIPDQQIGLVVEATLTNEIKRQFVRLSRPRDFAVVNEVDSIYDPSFRPDLQNLGRSTFEPEEKASVSVEDELGNVYAFSESEPGKYVSDSEFAAQPGVLYTLRLDTQSGASYISNQEKYENESVLENVNVERGRNENNTEGVFIHVDGLGTAANTQYFRYDYEETYKIIAPEWRPLDYVLTNYDPVRCPYRPLTLTL
ncbi:DUF4249 family protein [Maribacter halichondriae]|uniref:DUF4249 family protein n=1 Tax=Maribacter halichondriae TaxID=2980554 RepID=UPI0023588AE3|nr:DUF4249 family protein [Maribacter sp. Hal144]